MIDEDEMSSSRPYLIRALYDWLVDNGLTPHILVNAEMTGVNVPRQYVDKGQVVLNIAPGAVQLLQLGNDLISFSARFGGVPVSVSLPPWAVLGIYARENGRGMVFPDEGLISSEEDEGFDDDPDPSPSPSRSHLRVVK